ncbi:MAG TPA: TrkA C-terminal domain-containing protein [Actinotalea sp.]|nr:TrkA C-terminal domain-containing protein [Actinotalea sp.]
MVWPGDTVLAAIIRGDRPIPPSPDDTLEAGDEILLIASAETPEELDELQDLLAPARGSTSATA